MIENRKSTIAVGLLLVLVPIYVGRIQEVIPYLDKLHVAKIGMILGLAAFLITADSYRIANRHLFNVPQVKIIVAIFILGLISAPFGMWPGGSLDYLFTGLLKLLLFVYLLISITSTEEELVKVLWAFVVSGLMLVTAVIIAPSVVVGRVYTSVCYDPNDLALVLVVTVPLIFYMAEEYIGWKKVLLYGGMFFTLVVIIKTGSRGGFLALCAAGAAIFFQKGLSYTLRRLPFLLVLGMLVLSMSPKDQLDRLNNMFEEDYNTTSKGGRMEIWKRGITIMLNNPVLGCGINQFSTANGRLGGGTWQVAHNSYIQVGAELGVTGLALYIMLIRNSFASLREAECVLKRPWIVNGLRAGFYGLCAGMMFLSWAYTYVTFFVFGLCIVVRKIYLNAQNSYV